jgi:hypothetical protein
VRTTVAAVALGLLLPLAGCGDPVQNYCSAVQEHRKEIADMVSADSGPTSLLEHLPMLRDLAGKAPDDLSDEWQTFLNAVENLDDALRRADLEPGDFEDGRAPAGTAPGDVKAVQDAAAQLADPDVVQAADGISQQATDVCKVNFGL